MIFSFSDFRFSPSPNLRNIYDEIKKSMLCMMRMQSGRAKENSMRQSHENHEHVGEAISFAADVNWSSWEKELGRIRACSSKSALSAVLYKKKCQDNDYCEIKKNNCELSSFSRVLRLASSSSERKLSQLSRLSIKCSGKSENFVGKVENRI